jgi:hypothetical protein
VSKTKTQSKCRVAFSSEVAPYFEQQFKSLQDMIDVGIDSSFERSFLKSELEI